MLLVFLSLCLLPDFSVQEKTSIELIEYLFNTSSYDKRIIPSVATGVNVPMNVSISLALQQIENLDEKQQALISHVVLSLKWSDQQLTWNPVKYNGVESLKVRANMIWMPDIVLYNSLKMDQAVGMHKGHVMLHHTGLITYKFSNKIESSCKTNVANYPFDKQECSLKFGSWSFNGFQLAIGSKDKGGDLTSYAKNGEWEILEFITKENKVVYGCCPEPYYDVTYYIKLRRQVLYYAMYFIIPCALIAMLAATIFLLPQDCSERITVGMCALVGLSFFFLLVSENMPASESVPLIGGYYSVTMLQMGFSYFMNVLVLRLHHMTDEEVPSWVRKLLLKYGARLLGKKFYTKEGMGTGEKEKENPDPAKDAEDSFVMKVIGKEEHCEEVLREDRKIAQIVKEEEEVNKRDVEWKQAAAVLNDFGLILHITVVFLTFTAMFFEVLFIAKS